MKKLVAAATAAAAFGVLGSGCGGETPAVNAETAGVTTPTTTSETTTAASTTTTEDLTPLEEYVLGEERDEYFEDLAHRAGTYAVAQADQAARIKSGDLVPDFTNLQLTDLHVTETSSVTEGATSPSRVIGVGRTALPQILEVTFDGSTVVAIKVRGISAVNGTNTGMVNCDGAFAQRNDLPEEDGWIASLPNGDSAPLHQTVEAAKAVDRSIGNCVITAASQFPVLATNS